MIQSLLIANRGEIACRVIRTARRMGIRTIAVYSDADAHALHVRQADEAVHIGPSPAAESYLRGDRIIEAAKQSGAEAIHPGYGFLSENADFAQAVIDAGLVWVGPKPESIRAMGLKDAAKKLMADAGVPVTPGYLGEEQSDKLLKTQAEAIGYPVLIKAVAGGGGKGMRLVEQAGDFAAALESCKREAKASFGNDRILLEKFVANPRHIEVQVFGDSHGNVVHLFERDCSLQRRHQKVIEEAPAPGMDEETRTAICEAAVKAAKAVDYVGAGTVEFIADASEGLRADRIWFMEMNTRLQVEHPVTEAITGVDLVEWQLRVASGEKLPLKQDEIRMEGHAIEARLYAEDPARGFLPSTGRLERWCMPEDHVRIDTGYDEDAIVPPFYDPMLAKVIVHHETRKDAIWWMANRLEGLAVWPVKSNAALLYRCIMHPAFAAGDVTTSFIEMHEAELASLDRPNGEMLEAAAKQLIDEFGPKPAVAPGFRLNAKPNMLVRLSFGGEKLEVAAPPEWPDEVYSSTAEPAVALVTKKGQTFAIALDHERGTLGTSIGDGAILAPMPGKLIALDVSEGQEVRQGERLMVLEAMKMEHALTAPFAGRVADLPVKLGAQVEVEALLARIEQEEG